MAVQHHLDFLQGPELLELGLELPLAGVQTQAEHAEALAGLGLVSVALVTRRIIKERTKPTAKQKSNLFDI